jgi:hypothetical protein
VSLDIHSGRERAGVSLEDNDGTFWVRFDFDEHSLQVQRRRKINDVKRRIDQLDSSDARRDI